MSNPSQLPLFPVEQADAATTTSRLKEFGTFKHNMRSPIHRWFKYPAGFSYKFVDYAIDEANLGPGNYLYDPFSGTGTTLVQAKQRGLNAYGVEAHEFVHWVASVKLFWDFDYTDLRHHVRQILSRLSNYVNDRQTTGITDGVFPELVYKCYHPQTLIQLYLLREGILDIVEHHQLQELLKLALTDTLRTAAAAGTGWPYIAPNKNTGDKPPKNAIEIFAKTARQMVDDLYEIGQTYPHSLISNVLGDSRRYQHLDNSAIDIAITSPPYLNNYDYADRTRLESYFWGITQTWKEITKLYRDKLIVAATTQIVRSKHNAETALTDEIRALDEETYKVLQTAILELSERRLSKGGKKDYDLMVALYFNDMLRVIRETLRLLKPGARFYLVLGDSAPYGVHIQTEEIVGRIGMALGFRRSDYIEFRKRGGKWKKNPQRHNIPLREGVLILEK